MANAGVSDGYFKGITGNSGGGGYIKDKLSGKSETAEL